MTYPAIPHRRMVYDLDGTVAAQREGDYSAGIQGWLTPANLTSLNTEIYTSNIVTGRPNLCIWVFFPELREIESAFICGSGSSSSLVSIQGSNDTHNGVDGTWETPTLPSGAPYVHDATAFQWRSVIRPISFSGPKRVLRFKMYSGHSQFDMHLRGMHFYGSKFAPETPDDILIMENSTDEFTALKDWGNRPEGTVEFSSFRLKNASSTKTANNINVQLNHNDFLLSWSDEGPWVTFVDIASLSPGAVSSPIYIKNELPPPLLILGPRAARVIVGVGSWS